MTSGVFSVAAKAEKDTRRHLFFSRFRSVLPVSSKAQTPSWLIATVDAGLT